MRNVKMWLLAAFLVVGLAGVGLLLNNTSSNGAEPPRAAASHWRHHDGHWSYWHEGDKRWYYTDGSHWFYNTGGEGDAWKAYRFDKGFGKEGFERGDYKVIEEENKVVVPRHGVFRPRIEK